MEKPIYFDNAATTRMDAEVLKTCLPFMKECFGNANGKYSLGYEARHAVNEARKQAASMIGAHLDEIYFTSGGTEGNDTIIRGFASLGQLADKNSRMLISSEIEHDSILKTVENIGKTGIKVRLLKPDASGVIKPESLQKILEEIQDAGNYDSSPMDLSERHILVSVMLVNNETGVVQPIKELAEIAHSHKCIFHCDAVQAAGHMRLDVDLLGIDALTVSGHKLYGPKGTGFIYLRRGVSIAPLMTGGGQERGMRSGTENVPGIVGLGKACELSAKELDERSRKESEISEYIKDRLLRNVTSSRLNGEGGWVLNFSFDGINGTSLQLRLDMEGICVSTGSACSAGLDERSHVLTAMGLAPEQADSSIRISIGKYNTMEEAQYACGCIDRLVSELRSLSV